MIDEADSLLFPRGRAQRSWEVSFTNEFLTQMERFRGLLIFTTNRVTDLDDASLRRFSRKVEFRPLTGGGALMLYRRLLAPLAGSSPTPQPQEDVERIAGLTPGISRLVRDEAVLSGRTPTHGDLIAALHREIGPAQGDPRSTDRVRLVTDSRKSLSCNQLTGLPGRVTMHFHIGGRW